MVGEGEGRRGVASSLGRCHDSAVSCFTFQEPAPQPHHHRTYTHHHMYTHHQTYTTNTPHHTITTTTPLTFSILRVTGGGLAAVTADAISCPMRNASARDRPGSTTNMLSVAGESGVRHGEEAEQGDG